MRHGVKIRARLIEEAIVRGGFRCEAVMITPTYAPGNEWKAGHLQAFTDCIRKHLARRGVVFRYVWVAELQTGRMAKFGVGGAEVVHYHMVLWLPRGLRLPKPDEAGWWPHGMTRIEVARHGAAYIAKYATKAMCAPEFPRGLRLSGAGGLELADRRIATWCLMPKYVRDISQVGDRVRRVPGGLWCNEETGELVRSRWRLVERTASYMRFVQLADDALRPPSAERSFSRSKERGSLTPRP
jgi:hypothetical protein